MSTLITGADGYVGKHLLRALPDEISNSCLYPSHKELDICNWNELSGYFETHTIDRVLHLAAVLDNRNKEGLLECNLIGLYYLLRLCRDHHVKQFVFASGNNVFEKCQDGLLTETSSFTPLPSNYYGITKMFGEMAVSTLLDGTGTDYVILRIGDIYGPYQKSGRLLQAVIKNILHRQPQKLYGIGDRTRDYIYIDDVVNGLIFVMLHDLRGTFNLATGIGTNVIQFIEIAEKISPCKEPTIHIDVENEDHSRVILDVRKLADAGFKAQVSMEEGLRKCVEEESK